MSRPALERTALRLLKSRMEQKNGVQRTLMQNGIMFKIDEQQAGLPEIISEETFVEILQMADDDLPTSIDEQEYENDDLDDDGLMAF
jgi:ABC-type branched-subunit amino acid transport system ATPase component